MTDQEYQFKRFINKVYNGIEKLFYLIGIPKDSKRAMAYTMELVKHGMVSEDLTSRVLGSIKRTWKYHCTPPVGAFLAVLDDIMVETAWDMVYHTLMTCNPKYNAYYFQDQKINYILSTLGGLYQIKSTLYINGLVSGNQINQLKADFKKRYADIRYLECRDGEFIGPPVLLPLRPSLNMEIIAVDSNDYRRTVGTNQKILLLGTGS